MIGYVAQKLVVELEVLGAPRTKKNHGERWRPKGSTRTLTVPSKAWREWLRTSLLWRDGAPFRPWAFTANVNCFALFYRDANRGDACGYYQGLADLLEKKGVIENDRQIVSWDGSRLLLDRENPRTVVVLEEVEGR